MYELKSFEGTERRHRERFPIALGARYVISGRQLMNGNCRTVNISSRGLLIESSHELPVASSIRVAIEWPVRMDNVCPLALHVGGTVVRCENGRVAVRFSTYEWRTQPKQPSQLFRDQAKLQA